MFMTCGDLRHRVQAAVNDPKYRKAVMQRQHQSLTQFYGTIGPEALGILPEEPPMHPMLARGVSQRQGQSPMLFPSESDEH